MANEEELVGVHVLPRFVARGGLDGWPTGSESGREKRRYLPTGIVRMISKGFVDHAEEHLVGHVADDLTRFV